MADCTGGPAAETKGDEKKEYHQIFVAIFHFTKTNGSILGWNKRLCLFQDEWAVTKEAVT